MSSPPVKKNPPTYKIMFNMGNLLRYKIVEAHGKFNIR